MIYKKIIHKDKTVSLVAETNASALSMTIINDGESENEQINEIITKKEYRDESLAIS